MKRIDRKLMASESHLIQFFGAAMANYVWMIIFILLLALHIISMFWPCLFLNLNIPLCLCGKGVKNIICIAAMTSLFFYVKAIADTLNKIFCLRKEDAYITNWQSIKLFTLIIWIIIFVILFGNGALLSITIVGTALGWIFQDSIRGVVAFYHLRSNGMLHIGDWIKVDKYGVDGKITSVALTLVIVENWDTTTSSVPLGELLSEQVQNLQKMNKGRTYGRRMLKSFIIDTGWIHPLTTKEVFTIKSKVDKEQEPFIQDVVKEGVSNMHVFREYLKSYLLNHKGVSHEPRLIVRWCEQTVEGIPLQVYAFLLETEIVPFERLQSDIIEHIVESMEWFGLKLYQSPSGYDASNSNIFMTDKEATYGRD